MGLARRGFVSGRVSWAVGGQHYGEPIEGAVVVANWDVIATSFQPRAGDRRKLFRVSEAITDSNGRFVVANLGSSGPAAGWRKAPDAYPRFMAYKAAYETRFGNQNFWISKYDALGAPLVAPDIAKMFAPDDGVILGLRKVDASGLGLTPSRLQYAQSAASYLTSNIDSASLAHTTSEARRAIQGQIRALVTVDHELTRLKGKTDWDYGEIDRAIEAETRRVAPQ